MEEIVMKKAFIFFVLLTAVITVHSKNTLYDKVYFGNGDYYKPKNLSRNLYVSNSKYDFSDFALSITEGCNSDYERIAAIYKWICDNIEYDTSYEIYEADLCIEKRRGVCQAYCDLFYHISKSIGIRTEIVTGKSKDFYGSIGKTGHAWIFAYTRDNYGILLDPTWGAGSVNGNEYVKNKDCWVWFNVNPKWMILSHFPDNESYQLLDSPISQKLFYTMRPSNPIWIEYGLNPTEIADKIFKHELQLPDFFNKGEGKFKIIEIPMQKSLRIGQFYTFRIQLFVQNDIAIFNENSSSMRDEWRHEGNGIYSINFMPKEHGTLSFSIQDDYESRYWNTMIQYDIEYPNQEDWDNLNKYYPLKSPSISKVKNIAYEKEWADAGIDNNSLAQHIRENNINELPLFYTDMGEDIKIVSIPMNGRLKSGRSYRFTFYSRNGVEWAIINNNEWHRDWNISGDDKLSMTITPEKGKLGLYVQYYEGGSFHCCIEYKCE